MAEILKHRECRYARRVLRIDTARVGHHVAEDADILQTPKSVILLIRRTKGIYILTLLESAQRSTKQGERFVIIFISLLPYQEAHEDEIFHVSHTTERYPKLLLPHRVEAIVLHHLGAVRERVSSSG